MLASTPQPHPCSPSFCPPLFQGAEEERGAEKALTLSQGPRTLDLCDRHITPMVFWGKGVTSLSREVCKTEFALSRTDKGRGWGLALEVLKGPSPALIL